MEVIDLKVFGITVSLTGDGGGSIVSDLKEGDKEYDLVMDGIESMILGHAVAGVDIKSPGYREGIESAVQAAAANIEDPIVPTVALMQNENGTFDFHHANISGLKVIYLEKDLCGEPTMRLGEEDMISWQVMAEHEPEVIEQIIEAIDKGVSPSHTATTCDCGACLSEGGALIRVYESREGAEPVFAEGHYDNQGAFITDSFDGFGGGEYRHTVDKCASCESEIK